MVKIKGGILTRRREAGAVCPRCKHPNYILLVDENVNRPLFRCDSCECSWTNRYSGEPYMSLLR